MTALTRTAMKLVLASAAVIGMGASAQAQSVSTAIASGDVGEQADGYLGISGSVPPAVRAEMEQINIKRRQAYTDIATRRGVSVQDAAASVGCQALGRVREGQAYNLGSGWQRRSGPIALPAYCAG